jgi:hypothetical protein
MYTIYRENRERVPYNQIRDKYKGRWVFLVNLEGPFWVFNEEEGHMEECDPVSAEILIEADRIGGGYESGIYEEIRNNPDEYGVTGDMDCRIGNILPSNFFLVKDGIPVE